MNRMVVKYIYLCVLSLIISIKGQVNDKTIDKNSDLYFLDIPPRSSNAVTGIEFANKISSLSLEKREQEIVSEFLSGNVPKFSRKLKPIIVYKTMGSTDYKLTFFSLCDYIAIGSEEDYMYIPMTPSTAQFIADRLNCTLPTSKMVDIIYSEADIKLNPQPIPPSSQMTTVPVFMNHTDSIKKQIRQLNLNRYSDSLFAGHKKDIIISNKIYSTDRNYDRVVIYGWHLGINNPIQPVYNGHSANYADYSHGVRLILNKVILNEDSTSVNEILQSYQFSSLLSNEGKIPKPFYPPSGFLTSMNGKQESIIHNFKLYQNYPNPFNPTTTIKYSLPRRSVIARRKTTWQSISEITSASQQDGIPRNDEVNVTLRVYDVLGRQVATLVNKQLNPGNYKITFNASKLNSGVYFYRLKTGNFIKTKRMQLLK